MGLLDMLNQYVSNSGMGGLLQGGQPQGLLGGNPSIPFNPSQNQLPQTNVSTGDQPSSIGFGQTNPYSQAISSIADIIGGWGKTPQQQAETAKAKAEAQLSQAQSAQKGMPFSGDNFDSQLVRQQAFKYIQAGIPASEAFSRAANDVLKTKQEMVPDPLNPGQFKLQPRVGLPDVGAPQQTIPAPGQVSTELLPPPSGAGKPDTAMFNGTPAVSPSFNPANANPYSNTGAVQLEAAKAGATKAAEAGVDKALARPSAEAALMNAIDQIDNVRGKISSTIPQVGNTTAGVGSVLSYVPGTQAKDLEANLSTIGANNLLGALQSLKDASKSGSSGLGALSDAEGRALKDAKAAIGQGQSPDQLKTNLGSLYESYGGLRQRLIDAFKAENGYVPEKLLNSPSPTAPSDPMESLKAAAQQELQRRKKK